MKFLEGGRSKPWRIAVKPALPLLDILALCHARECERVSTMQGEIVEGGRSKPWRIAEKPALPLLDTRGICHKKNIGIMQGEIFGGG